MDEQKTYIIKSNDIKINFRIYSFSTESAEFSLSAGYIFVSLIKSLKSSISSLCI